MDDYNGLLSNFRPCCVAGKKALFHRWADMADTLEASPLIGGRPAGQSWRVYGIIEREDGTVEYVLPVQIQFLDTQAHMSCFEQA